MWWMRVTYELHCPITVESSANLYSPNNPISANSCTIIQRVQLPFVIASMRGGHGDSCCWRSESILTLTLVLNKRLFVDFFGRRCFFRGLKYLNNLQWKFEATGSCCTSGHNVALGFNLLVPPGELLGKSTPECAGHVENLHAVKWTGLDWTGPMQESWSIFIQFPSLLQLSGNPALQGPERAAVGVRHHRRKDLVVQEGRVVWQSGKRTLGRDQSVLCSSWYRIWAANAQVIIRNKRSMYMYPSTYFASKPQVPQISIILLQITPTAQNSQNIVC